ncbi:DUF3055 domain-containing protein [Gorillibacterium timonense]|uniref:DUF3055 domain-containing protein n=1 Tax=Gorillibacterium timonense TaxID=1689269 RepID=UPI00071D0813|nr:DUF3055 domain-containing protein [Gorillibacterium timonense]
MGELDFLYDTTEQTSTRFVSFIGPTMRRFDLALIQSGHFYGKTLVADLQNGQTAILAGDDLEQEGHLERLFSLSEEEAAELAEFLAEVLGPVNFTDL